MLFKNIFPEYRAYHRRLLPDFDLRLPLEDY